MENKFNDQAYYPQDLYFGQNEDYNSQNNSNQNQSNNKNHNPWSNILVSNLFANLLKDNPLASIFSGGNINQNQIAQVFSQILNTNKKSSPTKADDIIIEDNLEEF